MTYPLIRILGGPPLPAFHPSLQQQPCSITGISHLVDIPQADLVILWWDEKAIEMPASTDLLGTSLSSKCFQAIQEYRQEENKTSGTRMHASSKAWHDDYYGFGIYSDAYTDFMNNVWSAVYKGAISFIVVPTLASSLQLSELSEAALSFGYDHYPLYKDPPIVDFAQEPISRPPILNTSAAPYAGGSVCRIIGKLGLIIDDWPFTIGMRLFETGPLTYEGSFTFKYLRRDSKLAYNLRYLPVATDQQRRARSLVLLHGEGALFIIPSPRKLTELIQAYTEITPTKTERKVASKAATDGEKDTPPANIPAKDTINVEPPQHMPSDKKAVAEGETETPPENNPLKSTIQAGSPPQAPSKKTHLVLTKISVNIGPNHTLGFIVKCDGKAIKLGRDTFLKLLAHVIDAELKGPGINPIRPKIGDQDISEWYGELTASQKPAQSLKKKFPGLGHPILKSAPRILDSPITGRYQLETDYIQASWDDLKKGVTDKAILALIKIWHANRKTTS